MNRDQWYAFVETGNRVWLRVPLPLDSADEWYLRLHVWHEDTVGGALELLERQPTGGRWPDLAVLVQTCRDVERGIQSRASAADASDLPGRSVRLCDWLDQGAPGYPGGEARARLIWWAVMRWQLPVEMDAAVAALGADVPALDDEIPLWDAPSAAT